MAPQVSTARSMPSCELLSLHDVREGLLKGSLDAIAESKEAPLQIGSFSKGFGTRPFVGSSDLSPIRSHPTRF